MQLCSFAGTELEPPAGCAVAPQYDTTHVYVSPSDVGAFTMSFLGTFGGTSTKQVVATVTPTPSSTTSQLLQTPVGTVSLFGFTTPVPAHFGDERNGYLVTDMDSAIAAARQAGADIVVAPFRDPIGIDAIMQWPGGVNMQLYWHFTPPSYRAVSPHPGESGLHLRRSRRCFVTLVPCIFARQSRLRRGAGSGNRDRTARHRPTGAFASSRTLARCRCS